MIKRGNILTALLIGLSLVTTNISFADHSELDPLVQQYQDALTQHRTSPSPETLDRLKLITQKINKFLYLEDPIGGGYFQNSEVAQYLKSKMNKSALEDLAGRSNRELINTETRAMAKRGEIKPFSKNEGADFNRAQRAREPYRQTIETDMNPEFMEEIFPETRDLTVGDTGETIHDSTVRIVQDVGETAYQGNNGYRKASEESWSGGSYAEADPILGYNTPLIDRLFVDETAYKAPNNQDESLVDFSFHAIEKAPEAGHLTDLNTMRDYAKDTRLVSDKKESHEDVGETAYQAANNQVNMQALEDDADSYWPVGKTAYQGNNGYLKAGDEPWSEGYTLADPMLGYQIGRRLADETAYADPILGYNTPLIDRLFVDETAYKAPNNQVNEQALERGQTGWIRGAGGVYKLSPKVTRLDNEEELQEALNHNLDEIEHRNLLIASEDHAEPKAHPPVPENLPGNESDDEIFIETGNEEAKETESFGHFTSGTFDDTLYCPDDQDEINARCAQADKYIVDYEAQGQTAESTASLQRAYLFKAQCCGYRWATEGHGRSAANTGPRGHVEGGYTQEDGINLMTIKVEKSSDVSADTGDSQDMQQENPLEMMRHAEENRREAEQFLRFHKETNKQNQLESQRQMQQERMRQQEMLNDPDWQYLMDQSMKNLQNAAQGLSHTVRSGSSGSASSSGLGQQQALPSLEKDPFGKFRNSQKDTANETTSGQGRSGDYTTDYGDSVDLLDEKAPKSD